MNGSIISIPFRPGFEDLCRSLRVADELREEFREVWKACAEAACPKAAFSLQAVSRDGKSTRIGDVCFSSRIMVRNFSDVGRAFAYAATCGRELYQLAQTADDELERWWIDQISERAMRAVYAEMTDVLRQRYGLGHTASMNPGSLPDFPIRCQEELFHLLKEETARIGLALTSSFLMLPSKSVSGFLYETETDYVNCQLCPRESCPSRRAAYDRAKALDYGLIP